MKNNWQTVSLGEVLIERREIPDTELLVSGEIPIVSKISFKDGKIELRTDGETKTNMILIRPGDLLVSGINAAKGAISVYNGESPIAATIHYGAYIPDKKRVDVKYLWWLLRSQTFKGLLEKYVPGGIKTELKAKRLFPIPIPFPSLSEQRRCVARIEEIDIKIKVVNNLINQANREISVLFRKSLKNIFSDFSITGTLNDVLIDKPKNGWSARCDNIDSGIPVLTLSAVTGFKYQSSAFKRTSLYVSQEAHYWLKKDDLLITRSNTPELVGHVALYNGTPSSCIYPDLIMRLNVNLKMANKRFVWYWLQSPIAREFIISNAKGTSPTMKKISQGIVMDIPYPKSVSLSKQLKIVSQLDEIYRKLEDKVLYKNKINTELGLLLPSVLDKAFKGEF
ncbi:MAG: restriction endonuclease subunit S [Elusimicrobiota bacterium]|nr:restriction endonuclease subunit S [Elusimicrobiota bacterium]